MNEPGHNVEIVYEDNHVLVAVKPHNIPSQGDSSGDTDMLGILKAYIKQKYDKPGNVYLGLVHRLDRPAGGLMLFARTSKAAARLAEAIRRHGIEKWYLCRCEGAPGAESGEMSDYLIKDTRTNMTRVARAGEPGAKEALLRYSMTGYKDGISQCEVELITGRPHQIRVQFASRGLPLVGDARYGSGRRQLELWALRLVFVHPVTKKRMEFVRLPGWEEL